MDVLWSVVLALVSALVVGVLVRRTISVGTGWLRNTVVSLVMGAAIWPITRASYEILGISENGTIPWLEVSFEAAMVFILLFAWMIVIQMCVLLALELVLPSGTFTQVARSITRLPSMYRRVNRLSQIQRLVVVHGLSRYMRPRKPTFRVSMRDAARATADAFAAAGVTFVKLGQFVATRADIVPPEFVDEFSRLQSDVPPVPYSSIESELTEMWGRPVEEIFREFSTTPMAAASVAQVHPAVLHDGTEVVVKVQRPHVRRQVRADSEIIMSLAERLEANAGWAQRIGVRGIVEGFLDSLAAELDYRGEIRQTEMLRRVAGDSPESLVSIPKVHAELSGERVIVMDRVAGVPLSKASGLLSQLSALAREDLARDLFLLVAKQVLGTGVFHADLHPGNIIVDGAGRAGLVDFGAVGRLDKRDRRAIMLLLLAFDRQDSTAAVNAIVDVFGMPAGMDLRKVQREVGELLVQFDVGMPGGSTGMFTELLQFVIDNGFEMPRSVAAAFRAISTLEGSLQKIDPRADLLVLVRENSAEILQATTDTKNTLEGTAMYAAATVPVIAGLPVEVSRVLKQLEDGSLDIGMKGLNMDFVKDLVGSVVDQLIQVLVAIAMVLAGVVLMAADFGPALTASLTIFTYFGAWVLLGGFVLAIVVLAPALHQRRIK
ncbi:ABC1 kinase family protein [Brevibacterium litoralis]|uniref:ABC1 kinase family protein n=1 Tax=Brevibacterium litoralis TaxID=3138935 RepID=UPI0032EE4A5A